MSSRSDRIEEEITSLEDGRYNDSIDGDDASLCSPDVINFMQKIMAEVMGTFFIVFAGCGSVVVNKMDGQVTFPGICITWGLIVMAMVYTLGHVSGGHFNPAVTIAFTALRRFPLKELPLYILAQLVGGICGSATLYALFNPKPIHFFGTVPAGSAVQSFVLEIIISLLLMFVICGVTTDSRAMGELGGLVVGSTILLNVFVAGPISGASMNPARSLGPAIIMHNYKAIWAYLLGPIIGTLLGGFLYNVLKINDEPPEEIPKTDSFLKNTTKSQS